MSGVANVCSTDLAFGWLRCRCPTPLAMVESVTLQSLSVLRASV